jgi:predicted nucleic acid-binding protein
MAWLRENERELYISSISIRELGRGIERIPQSARKTKLRHWLYSLCDGVQGAE